MAKLKLGAIPDDKPVKVSIELPAALHRNLLAYAELHARDNNENPATARCNTAKLTKYIVPFNRSTPRRYAPFGGFT